jgi:NADH:ubiquinone oxidoreductase subunit 2 (subunit N)
MTTVPAEFYYAVLPEIVLTVFACAIMMIAGAAPPKGRGRVSAFLALVGSLAALVATWLQSQPRHLGHYAFNNMVLLDPFTVFLHYVIIGATVVIVLLSMDYLPQQRMERGEFYAILLFGTVGMSIMASSVDLIMMFIGLEISSIASYVLAGFRRAAPRSVEASLKYLLLGSFATAFFLYGIALVYGASGSTNLYRIAAAQPTSENVRLSAPLPAAPPAAAATAPALRLVAALPVAGGADLLAQPSARFSSRSAVLRAAARAVSSTPSLVASPAAVQQNGPLGEGSAPLATRMLLISAGLMFVGLAFKVSAAPFHVWTPDVFEGAPAAVSAFLSAGPKAAAFALLVRILYVALKPQSDTWFWMVWAVAIVSMTVGNLAALRQRNLKRMLAYSSIAHAGYIMVAIASTREEGIAAVLFYLAAYVAMNVGAFAVVAHFAQRDESTVALDDYAGLGFRSPATAFCLSIFLFSLIGVPLTGGFFGKLYVFRAALHSHLIALAVIGLLNSAVAAFYYLRVIVYMYMRDAERETAMAEASGAFSAVMLACLVAVIWLGVMPNRVIDFAQAAANALLSR